MNLPTHEFLLPAVMLISGLPILVAAVLVARGHLQLINGLDPSRLRDPAAAASRFSKQLALVAISMFLAALGFYWGHGDQTRTMWVTIALLVAVNGVAVAMIVTMARLKRDYLAPRDDQRTGRR